MNVKIFFLTLFWLIQAGNLVAQDKLLDRKGDEYRVKVLEITPDSVVYRFFADSVNAVRYIIPKSAVFMITYPNGMKDVFSEITAEVQPEETPAYSSEQLYQFGKRDARIYFKPRGAYWATLGSTLVYPPVGLGVGAAFAATPPAMRNIETPNVQLLKSPQYVAGYKHQARKQKMGKAAAGLGTAVGLYAVFFILLIAALSH